MGKRRRDGVIVGGLFIRNPNANITRTCLRRITSISYLSSSRHSPVPLTAPPPFPDSPPLLHPRFPFKVTIFERCEGMEEAVSLLTSGTLAPLVDAVAWDVSFSSGRRRRRRRQKTDRRQFVICSRAWVSNITRDESLTNRHAIAFTAVLHHTC